MPTYRVTMPDGKEFEVTSPDDREMSEDEILSALGQGQPQKPKITAQEYDTAWLANLAGLGFEVGDEVVAGASAANKFIGGIADLGSQDAKKPTSFSSDYSKELDRVRQSQQKLAEYDPAGNFVGKLAGGVPVAMLTGGPATQAAVRLLPNAGRVAQAAAVGAGFGAGTGFGSGEGGVVNRLQSAGTGALMGAGFGATIEGVVSPAVSVLLQKFRGNPRLLDEATGTLTPAGRSLAERAGVNPDELSSAYQAEFARQAQDAINPADASRLAQARSLPVPVPTTKGQNTLDPEQQMFESLTAEGSFGPQAGAAMRQQRELTQDALQENARVIQNNLGGGAVNEFGEGVGAARQALIGQEQALRARISELYKAAEANNGEAFVLGNNVADSLATMRQSLNNGGHTEMVAPRVHKLIAGAADDLLKASQLVEKNPNVSVGNLFAIRAQLSALSRSSDMPEAIAASTAKRQLDKFLDDAVTEDLISGDAAVTELWRRAIATRRELAKQFPKGSLAEKLVERTRDGNGLKLDANGAVNLIFGSSTTGWASRSGMVDGLRQVKALLKDSPHEWNALREEAFLRVVRNAQSTNQAGRTEFSGAKFKTAWERLLEKSPEVVRMMFSKEEIALINQFKEVANRVTTTVPGGRAFSGTPQGLSVIGKKVMQFILSPKAAGAVQGLPILEGFTNLANQSRAQAAMTGAIPRGAAPPPPVRMPGAITAAGSQSAGRDNRRQ